MKAFIGSKIFAPSGKLLEERPFEEAHSFLSNFIKFFYACCLNTTITGTDVAGTAQNINNTAFLVAAAATVTTSGILIGSGTTKPTLADYALGTQITTNVYHNATNIFLNAPSLSSFEIFINRSFNNNTGSVLTINEVGLVGNYAGIAKNFLFDHTLYTVTVGIGLSITLTYKIGITL